MNNVNTNLSDYEYELEQDNSLIRSSSNDEEISTTGQKKTLPVLIIREPSIDGKYQGENYYLVKPTIAKNFGLHMRNVTFHGCVSKEHGPFIFPQKNNTPQNSNSWNSSLKGILSTAPGKLFVLNTDRLHEKYMQIDTVDVKETSNYEVASFADFEDKLWEALEGNIIDSPDHPIIEKLLNK
jgi:hypothetical protein